MKITPQNIENYIIEYFEGRLSQAQQKYLLEAIYSNSIFKELFQQYQLAYLTSTELKFQRKEKLKKNPEQFIINEWEDLCIRYYENLLSEDEKKYVLLSIEQDEDKRKIFELYGKTTLNNSNTSFFSKKADLKKGIIIENYFEELCIHKIENNVISEEEEKYFEQIITTIPNKLTIYKQYKNTILKPDNKIYFPNKRKLKKRTFSIYLTSAIAASILFLFMWLLYKPDLKESKLAIYNKTLPFKPKTSNYQPKTTIKSAITKNKITHILNDSILHNINHTENKIVFAEETTIQLTTENHLTYNSNIPENSLKTNDTSTNFHAIKESLDKLFEHRQYNYFHELLYNTNYELTTSNNPEKKLSLWHILKKTSSYLNRAGTNISVKEYQEPNRIKKEIAIGGLYFSRTYDK